MTTTSRNNKLSVALLTCTLLLAGVFLAACQEAPQGSKQETFPSAEDAVVAMVDAVKASDTNKLVAIFGPEAREAMSSGDEVADQRGRDLFVAAYYERSALVGEETAKTLHIGSEDWPFPIPLVKEAAVWRFDTAAGIDELLFRRIGRNELATILACEAYVAAQKEYAQKGHDGRPAGTFAQKFGSDPGKQNGLFWRVGEGEEQSPLGELAAAAAAEGYTRTGKPTPFRGYLFRILTAHGADVQGGAKSYLVKGDLRNGFALVAYPAEYGGSGVMTLIVNQDGVVYQKDLGPETAKVAVEMKEYNPDKTWTKAQ